MSMSHIHAYVWIHVYVHYCFNILLHTQTHKENDFRNPSIENSRLHLD